MEDSHVTAFILFCSVVSLPQLHSYHVTVEPFANPLWFIQGRPFAMTCTVTHELNETTHVEWQKNGAPVDTEEYEVETWMSADNLKTNLKLSKDVASAEDLAHFMCSAGEKDAQRQTEMFSVYTTDANVTEGYETTLKCEPELTFLKKTVTWVKDDVPLLEVPELEGRVKMGHDNTTVSFLEAKLSDSGVYSCQILINPDTKYVQIFQENVTLHGKPYVKDGDVLDALINSTKTSIVLKCPAGGYPVPEVFWLRGDDVLEATEKITMTTLDGLESALLTVTNLTADDYGQYTCTAQNSMGKASVTMTIINPNSDGNVGHSVNKDGVLGVSVMMCLCVCLIRQVLST